MVWTVVAKRCDLSSNSDELERPGFPPHDDRMKGRSGYAWRQASRSKRAFPSLPKLVAWDLLLVDEFGSPVVV